MKVKELLKNPENWTQGYHARDVNNIETGLCSADATKFCLAGAVIRCYALTNNEVLNKIMDYLKTHGDLPDGIDTIAGFNDNPNTTHEKILEMVTALDI